MLTDEIRPMPFGNFKLGRQLGQGGVGTVYLAEDPAGRTVALKIVPPHVAKNDAFMERFSRECKALRSLQHPGIPRLFEEGVEAGQPYLTMEYVEGRSIHSILGDPESAPTLTPDFAANLLTQTSNILAYAHGLGVIHRDISPRNIILASDGTFRIIDFGIAKLIDETTLTMTGQHFGTPAYMAPEQFSGGGLKDVDGRADLWSLGVIGFEILTGRTPFEAGNMVALLNQIANPAVPVPLVREVRPEVGGTAAARVVDRLLEKDVDDRYNTAADVAEALEGPAIPAEHVRRKPSARPKDRARRWKALAGVGAAALLIALAGVFFFRSSSAPPEAKQTESNLLHPKYKLPASCFAYVGYAGDPRTWKLPYLLADGSPDPGRLPGAINAVLGNFRGRKVSGIPEQDIPDVLVRLGRAAVKSGKMPFQTGETSRAYELLEDALKQSGRLELIKENE